MHYDSTEIITYTPLLHEPPDLTHVASVIVLPVLRYEVCYILHIAKLSIRRLQRFAKSFCDLRCDSVLIAATIQHRGLHTFF